MMFETTRRGENGVESFTDGLRLQFYNILHTYSYFEHSGRYYNNTFNKNKNKEKEISPSITNI